MKTTGLTLQEAASLLLDGKCTGIKHGNDIVYTKGAGNQLLHPVIDLRTFHLGPIWSLINPVQEYEEVEVVRWVVVSNAGGMLAAGFETEAEAIKLIPCCPEGSRVIKMTGIDRVPKKEPVTRRVEIDSTVTPTGSLAGVSFWPYPETHGKTGKLIFEWDE